MKFYIKSFVIQLAVFFSITVYAKDVKVIDEVKNHDGSIWLVEKKDADYNVKYINAKGREYDNNVLVTSDIEGSNLSLNTEPAQKGSIDAVSLVMNYPRDAYIFKFSFGEVPYLLSACKVLTLPSAEKKQAVALLTLCSKKNVIANVTLADTDADKLLLPGNLSLKRKVKTLIGTDKSFLYGDDKRHKPKNPYLIKGDVVEIIDCQDSMLKIRFMSQSGVVVGWIHYVDIL